MAATNPTATLTSLLQKSSIEDHDEILKATNVVLKASKGSSNTEALHTRIVALLKLDRFGDALRALDEGGDKLASQCALEKAYALYKTGQLDAAEEHIQSSLASEKNDQKVRGLQHIAAQVAYRSERFTDAAALYAALATDQHDLAPVEGEENDVRINTLATDAQIEWAGQRDKATTDKEDVSREDMGAFETVYNVACGLIAKGDLGHANTLLQRARYLCEALDELSDAEKAAEVLPILVQQAFVLTKLGKLEEAKALENMINIADVPEPPTKSIAQNNSLATSREENPFMIQRIFESLPKLSHTEKHFEHQENILRRNQYTIDLECQKFDGVERSTAAAISKSAHPTISPSVSSLSVINAAAHSKNQTDKAGLKQILPLLQKRPHDVGLILTVIHLYVLMNNFGPAIALLETLFSSLEKSSTTADLDVRFAPGLVSLIVSLYKKAGRKALIKQELSKAADYWRQKTKPSVSLLQAAGVALLDSSKPEDLEAAGAIFSSLREQNPDDPIAIAGFVGSYASSDFEKVKGDLDKLSPISQLIGDVDAAALEEAGVPSLPAVQVTGSKRRADAEQDKEKDKDKPLAKKPKLSKKRMPKEYVEGKKLDPERWLPLRDRSSYRPKGKKGKKRAMEATQGGIVKDEESLELAGGTGTVKVEKAGGGGTGKGKKKKGKK